MRTCTRTHIHATHTHAHTHTHTHTLLHIQDTIRPTRGWLRLVGSLKLYVSFAKEPYKRDYILHKRPVILRSLLIVATPYKNQHRISSAKEKLFHTFMRTNAHTHTQTHTCTHTRTHTCPHAHLPHFPSDYGVATMSRLLKIISLFCKRAL